MALEQEVIVRSVQFATRPNGDNAVQVTFSFESPFVVKKPSSSGNMQIAEININSPGMVAKTPEEIKAVLFFSVDEWKNAEKRFRFGSIHKMKVNGKGQVAIL